MGCEYVCLLTHIGVPSAGAHSDHNTASDTLELELQAVVKDLTWVLGDKLRSSRRAASTRISLAPRSFISNFCHHLGCYWCCCSDGGGAQSNSCIRGGTASEVSLHESSQELIQGNGM